MRPKKKKFSDFDVEEELYEKSNKKAKELKRRKDRKDSMQRRETIDVENQNP
jgi:hypothetical protein